MSWLGDTWTSVKAWFKNSETIFLARLTTLGGFLVASTAAMDWSPLWSFFGTGTKLNYTQLMSIGGFFVFQGIILEIARRRNAAELKTS